MIKTDKITIIGEYLLDDKLGFIIGGQQFIKGLPPKATTVTEETYELLLKGVKDGWFNLVSDDYDDYLTSRGRKRELVKSKINPAEFGFNADDKIFKLVSIEGGIIITEPITEPVLEIVSEIAPEMKQETKHETRNEKRARQKAEQKATIEQPQ